MYSFEWKIFSWCETVKDFAKEKSPAETKERCRKSRLSLVHTAKVCVHTPTHARGGRRTTGQNVKRARRTRREGEPSSPPQQRLAEIHKSKMDELLVEVCGENGANYKVNIDESTAGGSARGWANCPRIRSAPSVAPGVPSGPELVIFPRRDELGGARRRSEKKG